MMQNSGWLASPRGEVGKRGLIIYVNPVAGGGRAGRIWQRHLRDRPKPWRLWLDEDLVYDGPLFVAAFANGHAFGGGMRVAPDAKIDDWLADLVVVPPVPRWTLPLRLPQFLRGSHVRLPFVHVSQGRTLRVEPRTLVNPDRAEKSPHVATQIFDSMPPFDLDGESFPAAATTFSLHRNALLVAA